MVLYLLTFLVGGILFVALWRYILIGLYWLGMSIAVVLAWRIVQRLDAGALTSHFALPIFIGAMSALVVCILASGYIRHALIWFYLRSAIQRDKDNAQKGKLW